ncbi:MAG: fibronectin type III protein, partial [uncultured bacterium]
MPEITDNTPPELASATPSANAYISSFNTVSFRLSDRDGTIDDAFVMASIILKDSQNQPVAGNVSESSDLFTFTPSSALIDGFYTMSFTAKDNHGNQKDYNFSFTLDTSKPAIPTISGGLVKTGNLQQRPFENKSTSRTVTLQGERESGTSVWINNTSYVNSGIGNWTTSLSLNEGNNALEIFLKDNSGNKSDSVWVDIYVDSLAPSIISITPANDIYSSTVPATLKINFNETGSLINEVQSLKMIKTSTLAQV